MGFIGFFQLSKFPLELGLGVAEVHSDFFDSLPGSLS
jgi:hypothetical protein